MPVQSNISVTPATAAAATAAAATATSTFGSSSVSSNSVSVGSSSNPVQKKSIQPINLLIGAGLNLFEVSSLGQPCEVVKTQMAANRGQSIFAATRTVWSRGGIFGFYQGLIPWAWIEASTKGAVLIFSASELEYACKSYLNLGSTSSAIISGMGGGICQAYATMGFCTFMKTVEVTRHKGGGGAELSTVAVARDILKKEGIRGINKGVNAVAIRQCTNWGSRFGFSRLAEDAIRWIQGTNTAYIDPVTGESKKKPLSNAQRILASAFGGAISCWNQPIEVIRVEMQSQVKQEGRPEKLTISQAAKWIYEKNGAKGFYRGVTPRVCLGIWQTVCMVFGGDIIKKRFGVAH